MWKTDKIIIIIITTTIVAAVGGGEGRVGGREVGAGWVGVITHVVADPWVSV